MALFRLFSAIFAILFVIWAVGTIIDILGGAMLFVILGGIITVGLSFGFLWDTIDGLLSR